MTKPLPNSITKTGNKAGNDKDYKFGGSGVVLEAYTIKNNAGEIVEVALVAINTHYGEIDDVTTNNDKKNPYKQVLAHLDDGDIDIIVLVKG